MLYVIPPFWTAKPYFDQAEGETFHMTLPSPAPERRVTFKRSPDGSVGGFTMENMEERSDGKLFLRLNDPGNPALLFLRRQPQTAARAALANGRIKPDDLAEFGLLLLTRYPARHDDTAAFLEAVSSAYPQHARLRALYGYALVGVDKRERALQISREALALNPDDEVAQEAMRRLSFTEPAEGEGYRKHLPFLLRDAFAPPDAKEVREAKIAIAKRDLNPRAVAQMATHEATLKHAVFDVRIIAHEVRGSTHYGAVFAPKNAHAEPLPVVIDARGVNPTYSPRDVTEGTTTIRALGVAQDRFIFLIPDFRGNTLVFDGQDYVSDGDPSDAWDGATDDAIAFLSAALTVTPEADPENVAIIGYSRGGSVALLAGARDPRIDLVLNIAGPVDHFAAQDQHFGWPSWEVIADSLRDGEIPAPTEEGGQDFDHFLDRVVTGGESLEAVRRRMIGSSPLYFLENLPEAHSWYGAEDHAVPIANPKALAAEMDRLRLRPPKYTLKVFDERGHDTDPYAVQKATVRHLIDWAEAE